MNTWKKSEKLLMVWLVFGALYVSKRSYDGYVWRSEVYKHGVYDIAVIVKKNYRIKSSNGIFFYSYDFKGVKYVSSDLLDGCISKQIFVGDTVLIKYTQKKPRSTVVDEKYRYISCYGIPPQTGWKKLPKCAAFDDVEYNTENTLFSFPNTIKTK